MSLIRFLLCFGILIAAFSNCQDTKSSRKESVISKQPDSILTKKNKKISSENTTEKSKNSDSISTEKPFKLTNENMKDFLLEYGEKNPETVVRLKTSHGNIDIQLFEKTPLHRANFIYLTKQNYFDETFFYRVAKGFVIQGGNSDREEMALKRFQIGDDYTLPQEQVQGLSHTRGSVALSKQWVDNPSNRSTPFEFFIVVAKKGAHHLDGEHTIFGKVIRGMNVVDKISNVPVDGSEWPLKNIFITAEVL